jgi:aminoglycoside 3-N-acetyltransferase I
MAVRDPNLHVHHLGPRDVPLVHEVLSVFGEAFEDPETYGAARPSQQYLERLLAKDSFILLAARKGDEVVGGIAAYELPKFEQARSEIYIYDLAVSAAHRREGIATAMIEELKRIAAERGAWVVYVQADYGDEPAIALYSKLGVREDVLHFDIAVPALRPRR